MPEARGSWKAWRSLLHPLLENEIIVVKSFMAWVSRAPTSSSSGLHSVWLITYISVFLQAAPFSIKVLAFLKGREQAALCKSKRTTVAFIGVNCFVSMLLSVAANTGH